MSMGVLFSSNVLTVSAAVEPVSVEELKAQARIAGEGEDALLTRLIEAARQWAERFMGRVLIEQTWVAGFSSVPRGRFVTLPSGPLLSVEQVEAYDERDNATLWATSNYYVDDQRVPARLVLRDGACWPDMTRCANGMTVTYKAGYGAAASDVPELIRTAILQLATHWFENRGEASAVDERGVMAPLMVQALLQPYKILRAGA